MAWGKKKEQPKPSPQECKHPSTSSWTKQMEGVTKPIKVKWTKCDSCGKSWNEVES